jgi:hypothetical protein
MAAWLGNMIMDLANPFAFMKPSMSRGNADAARTAASEFHVNDEDDC